MALQVWLPLNGDLKNKGCADVTVTNTGATIDNNGKIGKCYKFGTSASYVDIPKEAMNGFSTEASVCFWLKINTFNTAWATYFQAGLTSTAWTHYVFGFLRNNSTSKCCFAISDTSTSSQTSYLTPDLSTGVWYHFTITYKPGHCCIYVNGTLYQDYSTSITADFSKITRITLGKCNNRSSYQTDCYMNDFRIYDHCLSAAEVKEISRGLVLHYKLNEWEILMSKCKNINWNQVFHISRYDINNTYTINGVTITRNNNFLTFSGKATANIQTSNALWWDNEEKDHKYIVRRNLLNEVTFNANLYNGIGLNTTTIQTGKQKNSNYPAGNVFKISITNNTDFGSGVTLKINIFDLTKMFGEGNEPTLEEFNLMFPKDYYDYNTGEVIDLSMSIPDSSGYNNNATITGTLIQNLNSPRYDKYVYMNNTSSSNHIESNPISCSDNIFSVSFWIKCTKATNQVLVADPKISIGLLNGLLYVNPTSSSPFTTTNFTTNEWNHIVVIRNGSSYSVYINGVAETQSGSSNYYAHNVSKLWLLNRSYNNSYAANASISDFRIYATALSAEDILQLYQVSGKIDNLGNLYTCEFEESITGRELLVKNLTTPYNYNYNGTTYKCKSDDWVEFSSTTSSSCGTNYIEINPDGNTYRYDFTISVAAGNQFYIGFERFDANKTARSNNACTYVYTTKPSTDIVKRRYKGTVNLATDGTNPCKYIRLRVLNGWSGSDSSSTKEATIHSLSLREIPTSNTEKTRLMKTGVFKTDLMLEGNSKVEIEKTLDTNVNQFIEM